jgi:hypothetical protein
MEQINNLEINGVSYTHIVDSFQLSLCFKDDENAETLELNYLNDYISNISNKSDYCYYLYKSKKHVLWKFDDGNDFKVIKFKNFYECLNDEDFELVFLNTFNKIVIYKIDNNFILNKYINDL